MRRARAFNLLTAIEHIFGVNASHSSPSSKATPVSRISRRVFFYLVVTASAVICAPNNYYKEIFRLNHKTRWKQFSKRSALRLQICPKQLNFKAFFVIFKKMMMKKGKRTARELFKKSNSGVFR